MISMTLFRNLTLLLLALVLAILTLQAAPASAQTTHHRQVRYSHRHYSRRHHSHHTRRRGPSLADTPQSEQTRSDKPKIMHGKPKPLHLHPSVDIPGPPPVRVGSPAPRPPG